MNHNTASAIVGALQSVTESLPEDMQPFARQWKEHAEAGARSWWELERMAEKVQ